MVLDSLHNLQGFLHLAATAQNLGDVHQIVLALREVVGVVQHLERFLRVAKSEKSEPGEIASLMMFRVAMQDCIATCEATLVVALVVMLQAILKKQPNGFSPLAHSTLAVWNR